MERVLSDKERGLMVTRETKRSISANALSSTLTDAVRVVM